MSPRRVVVTGIGAVTPLGRSFAESWKTALQGSEASVQHGMVSVEECLRDYQGLSQDQFVREWEIARKLPCQVAAPVRDPLINSSSSSSRISSRATQLAIMAGREAVQSARLAVEVQSMGAETSNEKREESSDSHCYNVLAVPPTQIGVSIGNGMSGVREVFHTDNTKLSPYFIPKVLSNSSAGQLSMEYNLQGPNLTSSSACAASAHAIIQAVQCIQQGIATAMLAGGTEASIDCIGLQGFSRMRALATKYNHDPSKASRPFDRDRNGFVMGEGAAILVLEEYNHALQRQAPILAEVTGYGMSGDAHHSTAPHPEGRGALRAMQMAVESHNRHQHGRPIGNVDYINAHATSTPKGDEIEGEAILKLLNETGKESPTYVSSTKGHTGHLLGAAGALEAAITVQSLVDQILLPTRNLENLDDRLWDAHRDSTLEFVRGEKPVSVPSLRAAMSNSFGFGGTNASIIFSAVNDLSRS